MTKRWAAPCHNVRTKLIIQKRKLAAIAGLFI